MRSASEWAQARAMAADGLSQPEVAARARKNETGSVSPRRLKFSVRSWRQHR